MWYGWNTRITVDATIDTLLQAAYRRDADLMRTIRKHLRVCYDKEWRSLVIYTKKRTGGCARIVFILNSWVYPLANLTDNPQGFPGAGGWIYGTYL